jgi:hypothetical protein
MADEELKDLVASVSVENRETARIQRENALQMKEIERSLDKLCKKVGGMDDNIGHHAEQFFQNIFEEKLRFGGVDYDEMIPNLKHKGKLDEVEFDIVLVNGDSVALIEVKHRVHPSFVKELAEERIEKFRKYFQEFKDYKAYLGIAAFSFSDEVIDQASKYGVGVIRQAGEGIEMDAQNLKAY